MRRSVAGIVAAHAEQVPAAPGAGEQQGGGRRRVAGERGGEPALELLGSGFAVAQVELDDRVRGDACADPQRAAVRIEAEDVADQEIAGADDLARARQRKADAERVAEARAVRLVEGREQRAEQISFGRRPSSSPIRLPSQAVTNSGSPTGRQPWASTESIDDVAGEREQRPARAVHVAARHQSRGAGREHAAREPADHGRAGERAIESARAGLGVESSPDPQSG